MARPERRVRVPVALPEEGRPAAWLRNFRLSGFALSMLALIVAALLVLAAPLKTLIEQRQQIAQLEASLTEAQDAVDDLNAEVARWSDPAYIQAQARERLYYILPGDVSYLIVGEAGTAAIAGAEGAAATDATAAEAGTGTDAAGDAEGRRISLS